SDDPSQKVDRDVLEVLIELQHTKEDLPLGLRVTAQMTSEITPLSPDFQGMSTNLPGAPASPAETTPAARAAAPDAPTLFVFQVASMRHRESADALTPTLQKEGFPAFVLSKDGDPFYRVDVGPYPDAAHGRDVANKLKGQGFQPVIKRQYAPASSQLDSDRPVAPAH